MKVLHLTLKKKWFDMIKSGQKTDEYREIKPYWAKRLLKDYDVIRFRNGYNPESPVFDIELKDIFCAFGRPEWGAPEDTPVYVLRLGNILGNNKLSSNSALG